MNKVSFSKIFLILMIGGLILLGSSCSSGNSNVFAQSKSQNFPDNSNINSNSDQNLNQKSTESEFPKPEIVSRKDWKANPAVGKGKVHEIKFITIHHTATKQKPKRTLERKLKNLQNFSQSKAKLANGRTKPAWLDIPYHYYISVDGKIGEAREIKFAGDTNTSYDPTGHALIVLEGNFEIEKPSKKQLESLKSLTKWLALTYKISNEDIKAHNDYTSTACPGKNLKKLLPGISKKKVKTLNLQKINRRNLTKQNY